MLEIAIENTGEPKSAGKPMENVLQEIAAKYRRILLELKTFTVRNEWKPLQTNNTTSFSVAHLLLPPYSYYLPITLQCHLSLGARTTIRSSMVFA